MQIRTEQLSAFRAHAEAAFEERLVEYLRAEQGDYPVRIPSGEFNVEELPAGVLREMVGRGVARARGYGMTWESSLASFVVLMFAIAPGFDSHPLVRHVLTDASVGADLRLDRLLDQTTEENWDAVEERYDARDWGLEVPDEEVSDARRTEADTVES